MSVILWLLVLLSSWCTARLINVTIDDTNGDQRNGKQIQYNDGWQQGNGCDSCTAKPGPASSAWDSTWHDTTAQPDGTPESPTNDSLRIASVSFAGTAVYVSCITTGSSVSPDGNSDMTFYIDDVFAGVFEQSPNNNTSYNFGTIVFSKTDLADGNHTVRLEAGHSGIKSLVLLDAIIYSTSTDDNPTLSISSSQETPQSELNGHKSTHISAIVAGSVAGAFVLISITVLILVIRRRRKKLHPGQNTSIDPYHLKPKEESQIGRETVSLTPFTPNTIRTCEFCSCTSCSNCTDCRSNHASSSSADASSSRATIVPGKKHSTPRQELRYGRRPRKQGTSSRHKKNREPVEKRLARPLPVPPSRIS